jgi:hypothetical protein
MRRSLARPSARRRAQVAKCVELLEEHCAADFIDLNCGCPLDGVCSKVLLSTLRSPLRVCGGHEWTCILSRRPACDCMGL